MKQAVFCLSRLQKWRGSVCSLRPIAASAGDILWLIRTGSATTRAEILDRTQLARSTVVARLGELMDAGLVHETGEAPSSGGRPPGVLAFNPRAGCILAADLGQTGCHLAVCDLEGAVIAEHRAALAIEKGPDPILSWLDARFAELLKKAKLTKKAVEGIGIGVPGPVDHERGVLINPPAMPGWDGVDVGTRVSANWSCPVLVDNDVNIMALGEHRVARPEDRSLLFIKVGSGIGAGLVLDRQLYRGVHGAGGDIGHSPVRDHDGVICSCGNQGCLTAVASGRAIARRLDVESTSDVVDLIERGESAALAEVRSSGRLIGEVVATAVNMLDPTSVVIGGNLVVDDEPLLAAVREVVYSRATPLATHDLAIVGSELGQQAGVIGAACMVADMVLTPASIDARFG